MTAQRGSVRVGLLWRREWDPPSADGPDLGTRRLHGVFEAFANLGVDAVPVVYADDRVEQVRAQLLRLDGVLVWVNPIEQGLDRSRLDALLREVAEAGVWISAHPDVIGRMATKKVLVETASMGWGSDTRLYANTGELRQQLPARLRERARVLKQLRGMGGQGVWKVQLDEAAGAGSNDPWLSVQPADGDPSPQRMPLSGLVELLAPYFHNGASVIEQPFQERIEEGMIRVYLTHDRVVGFAHQYPRGLRPPRAAPPPPGKRFELADAPAFRRLRSLMEDGWVAELQERVGVDTERLPVIWDADFLYGPKTATEEDSYVLCEINASSTFAFPEHAMPGVARAALDRIGASLDAR